MSWSDVLGLLKKKSIRKGWRRPVRIPVTVIDDFQHQHPSELVEASPNGFRLRSSRKLPRNKELILRFLTRVEEDKRVRGEEERRGFSRTGKMLDVPAEILWNRTEGVGALRVLAGGRFRPMGAQQWKDLCAVLLDGPGVEIANVDEHRSHGRLQFQGSLQDQSMVIRDVSESGAGLLVRHPVPVNSRLEIALGGEEGSFTCRGRVVRCQEILKGSVFQVGLAFEKLDKKTRDQLTTFLAELLAEQARLEDEGSRERG